ncbi:PIN domain-containing protein [Candidatus Gottesmanbacteria bacterium]|nr:PIN domain-containing protein [Candidatus Gottesmanbacteria bacterium]
MSKSWGLVDSNLLIYSSDNSSVYQRAARRFLAESPDIQFFLTIQNLTEFYAIVTNPKRVNHSVSQVQAIVALEAFIASGIFHILFPTDHTPARLIELLQNNHVKDSEIHDVHLAAVMKDNRVDTIYTADTAIFTRLGLRAINPL